MTGCVRPGCQRRESGLSGGPVLSCRRVKASGAPALEGWMARVVCLQRAANIDRVDLPVDRDV